MSATRDPASKGSAAASWRRRLRMVGPGLVLAAGGVGAGDMISALSGSARFGLSLLWVSLVAVILKYVVTEGIGRMYMATGQTLMGSVRSVGWWLSACFLVFLLIMGLVYGAALSLSAALAANAMFPVLPLKAWAILLAIGAFLILAIGRYEVFERVMKFLVVLMFVGVVGTAAFTLPSLLAQPGQLAAQASPGLPEGSLLNVLALLGGAGGTFGVASYGYWVRDKGWRDSSWVPTMRIDSAVGYAVTFIFAAAIFVIGTQFLFGTGQTINGEEGLVALSQPLGDSLGPGVRWLFLLGFFSVLYSSLIGGWNGLCYLLADSVRTLRGVPDPEAEAYLSERSPWFRGFLAYCAFPSMILTLIGEQPVVLVLAYSAFGALILPLLSIVLLRTLNSGRVEPQYRNRISSNTFLAVALFAFVGLAVYELADLF